MRHTIKMPNVGETSQTVVILDWLVEEGGQVTVDQPLVRVETDKVEVEVPSPVPGTVVELLVDEGTEVAIGTPVVVIES